MQLLPLNRFDFIKESHKNRGRGVYFALAECLKLQVAVSVHLYSPFEYTMSKDYVFNNYFITIYTDLPNKQPHIFIETSRKPNKTSIVIQDLTSRRIAYNPIYGVSSVDWENHAFFQCNGLFIDEIYFRYIIKDFSKTLVTVKLETQDILNKLINMDVILQYKPQYLIKMKQTSKYNFLNR